MNQLATFLAEYGLYLGIPLFFLALVAWIYRPSAKKRYQADGNTPFYGDKKKHQSPQGGH